MEQLKLRILKTIKSSILDKMDTESDYSGEKSEIRYSINYHGHKDGKLDILSDTEMIEWYHEYGEDDISDHESACEHCGYGKNIYLIGKMNNGNYYYLSYWNGCMTYRPHMNNSSKIYIANSLGDIYTFCMDDKGRLLYDAMNNS